MNDTTTLPCSDLVEVVVVGKPESVIITIIIASIAIAVVTAKSAAEAARAESRCVGVDWGIESGYGWYLREKSVRLHT